MERVRKSGGGISRTTSDQTSDGGKILRGENEVVSNLCLCVYMASHMAVQRAAKVEHALASLTMTCVLF